MANHSQSIAIAPPKAVPSTAESKLKSTTQPAQPKSLEKRLRAQGGDYHRLDFALPDPQVCVDDLFGRLYPKRERGGSTPSLQGLKRDVRKALAHDQYTDVDMVNAHYGRRQVREVARAC